MIQGTCKLCGCAAELEVSHFIPKFVGKWIKKTSITGFIREHNNPAKREQDTAKEHWLCRNCEELFSKWETEFATNIFFPFVDGGQSTASYGPWMSKFCASLSWRTLTYIRSINPTDDQPEDYYLSLAAAETHLRSYLLGQTENLNEFEQHLFPLDQISSTTVQGLPSNMNRYFLRIISMDIIGNQTDLFVYTKIPSFMLLGLVKAKEPRKLRASRVAIKFGKITPRRYWWPNGFANYVVEKANEVSAAYQRIPQKDLDKFEDYIRRNPEKAANSQLFKAFLHDYEQFGEKVFK